MKRFVGTAKVDDNSLRTTELQKKLAELSAEMQLIEADYCDTVHAMMREAQQPNKMDRLWLFTPTRWEFSIGRLDSGEAVIQAEVTMPPTGFSSIAPDGRPYVPAEMLGHGRIWDGQGLTGIDLDNREHQED